LDVGWFPEDIDGTESCLGGLSAFPVVETPYISGLVAYIASAVFPMAVLYW